MPRKSAFFKRIAAMQCVAPNNPKPAWLQCYYILLQALDGYRISLDPKDTPIDHTSGWPTTQLRVLHELIYSARKMGNPAIAIRHISYLFHTLFDFLSLDDRRELVGILESYTCRCEGVSQTLALENGLILPPVPFFKFPKVYSFKLQCPPDHLLAKKYQKKKGSNKSALNTSPFIYSPIQFGVKEKASTSKMDFNWVQGEVCTIDVEAKNPLPIELQVNNISLLTEGTGFSVSPCNVTIPPSARARFNIAGTPESTGELAILGYQTNVFGCKSNCRFRDLHHIEESQYNVKVVPSLPKMTLSLSSPWKDLLSGLGIKHGTVSSAVIHVYAGQSCECTVRLKNSGELPIEMIDVQLADKTHNNLLKEILVWNQFNINSQLPIAPGNQASFTLYVNADKNPELAHQASTYNCSLTFQYSGAVGLEAGYCRQCTVDVQLHIEPVVTVHQVQVKQALYSAGHGDIELHLYNNTRHNVLISSQDQVHSQGIASHSVHKLNLQIPKCNITQDMLEEVPFEDHTANENQSFNSNCDNSQLNSLLHTSHVSSQSEGQRHDRIQILTSQIAQHISNFVDLKWKLPDSGVDGKLFVDSSKWDKWDLELLESLIKDPVVFAVSVNGEVHDPVSTPTVTCGEPVSIKCSVTNTSDCDIPDTCIHLWCPHVDDRCTDDHSLPYVIVGQNAGHIKMLKVGCVSSHQWEWLPLCPGVYDITVVVFPLDSQNLDTLNPDTHGTPYPDTQWTLNPDTMTQINLDDPESYPGSRKHGVLMRDSISTLNKRSHDVNQWTSVPITIIVK